MKGEGVTPLRVHAGVAQGDVQTAAHAQIILDMRSVKQRQRYGETHQRSSSRETGRGKHP